MAKEIEEKEKERAYVSQVKRDRQVWSSRNEDEEIGNNKQKGKIWMVATTEEDGSTNLQKNHYYMARYGSFSIVE